MVSYSYDDFSDSFLISTKRKNDKVKGSALIGNLVIDISTDGRVVGLEIRHFSEWLKKMKIDRNICNIKSADLNVTYKPESLMIFVYIKFMDSQEREVEERVPIYLLKETAKMAEAA